MRNRVKFNPLVGWVQDPGVSARDVLEPYAPLFKKDAEASFQKAYAKVKPNIIVSTKPLTRPVTQQHWSELEDIARAKQALVLAVGRPPREHGKFYQMEGQKRGSSIRITPLTPFNVLHRLGDLIIKVLLDNDNLNRNLKLIDLLYRNYGSSMSRQPALFSKQHSGDGPHAISVVHNLSRGVDTAAGRLGVLNHWSQVLSDLFAKYMLTGRIAYSPPPARTPEEHTYQESMKQLLPTVLQQMADVVVAWTPGVVGIALDEEETATDEDY